MAELPVSLLRIPDWRARKLASDTIKKIAEKASEADWVNIQYEPGLFGMTPSVIQKNLSLVLNHSKKAILTHHTILYPEINPSFVELFKNPLDLFRMHRQISLRESNLKLFLANRKKVRHLVHTKHARDFFEVLGIGQGEVEDHPLGFLTTEQKAAFRESVPEDKKTVFARIGLPQESGIKLVGGFGFLSPYKGYETLIHCLRLLPMNYHLLVTGGLHPEGVVKKSIKQPYLKAIMELVDPKLNSKKKRRKTTVDDAKLLERVHFLGSLGNQEFAGVMNACDHVVFPYSEEMQTSSGAAGMALDLGKRLFCSNNHCFRELRKYAGDAVTPFEISNHLELKTKIMNCEAHGSIHQTASDHYRNSYNLETRVQKYWELLSGIP